MISLRHQLLRRSLLAMVALAATALATVSGPAFALDEVGSDTGMFLILAEASSPEALRSPGPDEQVAKYDYKFLRDEERHPARYFILRKHADVPLELSGPVKSWQGERGTTELSFTLTDEAAAAAERVSRENLGKKTALMIDGEVITAHKIRSVITDGRFVLSRCTDTACEYIRARLKPR